jgi:outer membrane biosynthesis protein TonB
MRLSLLLSISVPLLVLPAAQGQPAEDFFNHGAQLYISNHLGQAMQAVTNGLQLYPDDSKLKKLEELLKQQSQSKNSQQQDQQSQQQNQKDQQSQKDQKQQKQEDQQEQQADRSQEKKPQNDQQQERGSSGAEKQQPPPSPQSAASGQMSPKEAQQLLDSQKNDELMLPVSRKEKAADQQRPVKDW